MTLKILTNFDLSFVSTFKIGGQADYFAIVKTNQDLFEALKFAEEKSLFPFIFGGGSNILFPDTKLATIAIRIATKNLEFNPANSTLIAQAGATWREIASFCQQHALYGLEGLYGLPGTIGGAVFGNSGCHNQETSSALISAEIHNILTDQTTTFQNADFQYTYRHSLLSEHPELLVLEATFQVQTDPKSAHGDPNTFAQERKLKQPQGLTTGSFFKNPKNLYAGQLIEQANLKGLQLNGMQISDKHANFFLNINNATAHDVLALKDLVQTKVLAKHQILLEPEVRIITRQDWKR